MTVGPWKPVLLQSYHSRIADLDIRATITDTIAALDVKATMHPKVKGTISIEIEGHDQGGKAALDGEGLAQSKMEFAAKSIDLWYPVGYGPQKLYDVKVVVHDEVPTFPRD
jgi:beta-mannosidase